MAKMENLQLAPGSVFGDRFEVDRVAGSGGMATVYRARDRRSGDMVALKLLHSRTSTADAAQRFSREAQLLSEVRHPGIVSYVAHGHTPAGRQFFAMEWLDGEDLEERLARGPLSVRQSVELLMQVADALTVAHQRGIIHRDLKPSNLFLRERRLDRLVLIDFGIAREVRSTHTLSRKGDVLGTPEYMAPEQARGVAAGPGADIFSLGCILYECLTGQPPFAGEHPLAILGKILFGEPPNLTGLRPEVPAPLITLLSSMLAKDPTQRPRDAAALRGELLALTPILTTVHATPPSGHIHEAGLTSAEQRLFSVVLATCLAERGPVSPDALSITLTSLGASVAYLSDGALLATLARVSSAQDQAALAARCALFIHDKHPEAQIAVATGRGVLASGKAAQIGEAIDRAAQMVGKRSDGSGNVPGTVWLDEVTAGLLGARFAQTVTGEGIILQGETEYSDETRLLLGRPAPCVGRDQELLMLESLLRNSATEPRAQGVLVVAPPGMGKSRLRHEFLARTRAQGAELLVLQGRASPLSAGSPYSILAQALRQWCATQRGEDLAEQRTKLQSRIAECVAETEIARVSEFLGELCDIPFPDEYSVPLLAARRDPQLMHEQIRLAFLDFVQGACKRRPMLLVLDDLHWGDSLSIKLIDKILRELQAQPFMVLALARPELKEMFPALWSHCLQEIPLRGLSKRAAERLCREVLKEPIEPPVLARIVERAAGNALYLEELIRSAAEGNEAGLPGTVMAMLQARILRLDATARQALRAASVLGETFWRGGLLVLLGIDATSSGFEGLLHRLIVAEVIEPRQESRFQGEREYRFRHGLMRDAAYSLLTADDQRLGHQLAARYLERIGETEAVVIAEHYAQGALNEQAAPYFGRAAEQSLDRFDAVSALARVERGINCNAQGNVLGLLRGLRLTALHHCHRWGEVPAASREALQLLPPGSLQWCRAMFHSAPVAAVGKIEQLVELAQQAVETTPESDATIEYIQTLAMFIIHLSTYGIRPDALRCLERMLAIAAPYMKPDPVARSWCLQAHSYYLRFLGADPWTVYNLNQGSVAAYELTGDLSGLVFKLGEYGSSAMEMGSWADAEPPLRRAIALAQRLPEPFASIYSRGALLINLVRSNDRRNCDEAHKVAAVLIPELGENALYDGALRTFWGQNWALSGQLDEAENELRKATALLQAIPAQQILAIAYLIPVLLKKEQVAESQAFALQGLSLLESLGEYGDNLVRFLVAAAEAHYAAGKAELAVELLKRACHQIDLRASLILDPIWRHRFLHLPENDRAEQLGRRWLDGGTR